MPALKILIIPGSIRTGSHNVKLAAAAAHRLAQAGADVTRISLADFPLPIFNDDLSPPRHAVNLKRMIGAHHGVLLVTPEHNGSIPALLKNAIDWVASVQEPRESCAEVLRTRPFAIAAASDDRLGGVRALDALRLILSACGAIVTGSQLALSHASEAYDDMDRLRHDADRDALDALVRQLIAVAQAAGEI